MKTSQSIRVKMSDYTSFRGVSANNVNQKINVRANILHCGSPVPNKLILH